MPDHPNTAELEPATKILSLSPDRSLQLDRRIRKLCDQHTPSNDLTEIVNRELGFNLTIQQCWHRARKLGLHWTAAKRRPPTIPEADLPACSYCGKIRMPVLYSLSNKGGRLFLCENRCCPTCGGKLEVHTVLDKATNKPATSYWAHALPLHPRSCANAKCGREFTPSDAKQAHKETCSRACMQNFAARNWEKKHPEEARRLQKNSAKRRRERTLPSDLDSQPSSYQKIVPVLVTGRVLGKVLLNADVFKIAGIRVSPKTMSRIRGYCDCLGPKGRPGRKL